MAFTVELPHEVLDFTPRWSVVPDRARRANLRAACLDILTASFGPRLRTLSFDFVAGTIRAEVVVETGKRDALRQEAREIRDRLNRLHADPS